MPASTIGGGGLMDSMMGFAPTVSALSAERERMQVIASNIANARTVGKDGQPYTRKSVIFEEVLMSQDGDGPAGVRVAGVFEDTQSEYPIRFDKAHPAADENGYVRMPNVDISRELVDMMVARRSYSANIAAFQAWRQMMRNAVSSMGAN